MLVVQIDQKHGFRPHEFRFRPRESRFRGHVIEVRIQDVPASQHTMATRFSDGHNGRKLCFFIDHMFETADGRKPEDARRDHAT